ncbi:hypothetical protein AAIG39_22820, partial [Phytobacter palmae]
TLHRTSFDYSPRAGIPGALRLPERLPFGQRSRSKGPKDFFIPHLRLVTIIPSPLLELPLCSTYTAVML